MKKIRFKVDFVNKLYKKIPKKILDVCGEINEDEVEGFLRLTKTGIDSVYFWRLGLHKNYGLKFIKNKNSYSFKYLY